MLSDSFILVRIELYVKAYSPMLVTVFGITKYFNVEASQQRGSIFCNVDGSDT